MTVGVVGLLALVVAGSAVFRAYDDPEPVAQDRFGPVLLVSGYGGNTAVLAPLAAALEASGRSVEVLPVLGDGTGDLDVQAEALAARAELAIENGAPSVDVVGYSAGGVVARAWVADHGGDERARRVVTIGSPHHGTDAAQIALDAAGTCPVGCRQLAPDSGFLRALNARDETPAGPVFVSVWSESDRVVTPADSARLDGAVNVTVQQLCADARTSHGGLPGDPAVIATTLGALAGVVSVPDDVSCQ